MRITVLTFAAMAVLGLLAAPLPVRADDVAEAHLSIKDRAFKPAEVDVPAGKKIKLTVTNEDAAASEFESFELNREKVVPANDQVTVYIGPLKAGTYPFFDDLGSAKGKIVAK